MSCGQEPFYANAIVLDADGLIQIKSNTDGEMVFTDQTIDGFIKLSDLAGITQLDTIRDCDDVIECIENNSQVIRSIIDCNYIQQCMGNQSIIVMVESVDWNVVNVGGQNMYEVQIPHGLIIDLEPASLGISIYDSNYDIITFDKINVGSTDTNGDDAIYVRSTKNIEFYISVNKI